MPGLKGSWFRAWAIFSGPGSQASGFAFSDQKVKGPGRV